MEQVKPWWASRTIWAAIGVLVVNLGPLLGVHVFAAEDADLIGETADQVFTALFALLAVWGRFKASSRVTVAGPSGSGGSGGGAG